MRKMYITDNNVTKYIINMFIGFTPQDLLKETKIKMNALDEALSEDSNQELIDSIKFYDRVINVLSTDMDYFESQYVETQAKLIEEDKYLKRLHNVLQSASEKYKRDYSILFEV